MCVSYVKGTLAGFLRAFSVLEVHKSLLLTLYIFWHVLTGNEKSSFKKRYCKVKTYQNFFHIAKMKKQNVRECRILTSIDPHFRVLCSMYVEEFITSNPETSVRMSGS